MSYRISLRLKYFENLVIDTQYIKIMKLTKTQPLLEEREDSFHVDRELDVRGLVCPLPILRTKKALSEMSTGQIIKISATDPGSVIDFQVFAEQTANDLLSFTESIDEFVFYLKKR